MLILTLLPARSALQEDVYKKAYDGEYFAYTFLALVVERGINALTAYLGNLALGPSGYNIPHKEIFSSGGTQNLDLPRAAPSRCTQRSDRA